MKYRHSGFLSVKKYKPLMSAAKSMLTIFWDASGVPYTDFLTKGFAVNSNRYCATLPSLKQRIRRTTSEKNVFHDDAKPHCSAQTQYVIRKLKLTVVPQPLHSQDLPLSDFWLFPKFKETLKDQHFSTDCEVQAAVRK
ncbi:hypothetical protein TNCV_3184721 [Trichonephila clavipes]|nr:hypothetical protein TNCV_3184721 [Trichonephila clavipes]